MGGEDQLKALIRQAFSLNNTADKSVVSVDAVLARTMATVKSLVQSMPKEGLLRQQSWRQLEPLVKAQIKFYTDQLGRAIVDNDSQAAPKMRDYAVREFVNGGAALPAAVVIRNQPVPDSVRMALNSKVNGKRVETLFALDGQGADVSPVNKALFRTIDTRVRAGLIRGDTTDAIADLMATDVVAGGVRGVSLTAPVAKYIRSQAMAIARTATSDMQRQVKEQLYEDNRQHLGGMVWLWTTALDSVTCETCAPLDQKRWPQGDKGRPTWPLHPNCRCQAMLIDPEDKFWDQTEVTAQQIRPEEKGPYKGAGAYKTPIVVKGQKYYRKAVTVTSDRPPTRLADVYARWATSETNASLVAAMGPARAKFFYRQFNEFNKDPQQILVSMLSGAPGSQKWIPIEDLPKAKAR